MDFVFDISFGSFLSVSSAQMDEILAGLQMSGVQFLRVARGEASRLNQTCGDTGQILPWSWCDQLRISCHSSAGDFLTHRWVQFHFEDFYAGAPMLTFPFFLWINILIVTRLWRIGKLEKG